MKKEIVTFSYGLSVFSLDTMTQFFKEKKIRSKKVLELFQKKDDLFLDTIKAGVWVPIPSINSGHYVISVDDYDEPFGEDWTEVFSYEGFNLDVHNGIWISDIGSFLKFDENEFMGEGREITVAFGTVSYFSDKEQWSKDRSGKKSYYAHWYDVPSGKYTLTISGYARKEMLEHPNINYGFRFTLKKIEEFLECKNPREEAYDFNTEWLHTTKPAKVYWVPTKENNVQWPIKTKEYKNSIIIPLENGQKAFLTIDFEIDNQMEQNVTDCRVKLCRWRKKENPENFVLESGAEYPICEWIDKRSKVITNELGRIKIV